MVHTKASHTRKTGKGKRPFIFTWQTNNEKSGTIGVKWYCTGCGFMMVFPKGVTPTQPESHKRVGGK